ncbi:MAG: diguanylate cyclase [Candidatus Baltobacteraceae bacterium]
MGTAPPVLWMLPTVALLCLCAGAYIARLRACVRAGKAELETVRSGERTLVEAARAFTAASRESSGAVLCALECSLKTLEPAVDALLVFTTCGEELHCVYAAGSRAQHYAGARLRRDDPLALPARAARVLHRIELRGEGGGAVIPSDRGALAVPLIDSGNCCAVVYASSMQQTLCAAPAVVRAAEQAAAPYALAAEREKDRARATYDALTGLYAPRAFRDLLQEDVQYAAQRGAALALWFVDTDRFKTVNDSLGHAAGDRVLQAMAALLKIHTIDGVDTAARNGGDEFCAILRGAQKIAAIERAARLCRAVAQHDFGIDLRLTASIGIAAFPGDAERAADLLEIADAAMYNSKRSGRGCVSFAAPGEGFAVYR